jgi:hypothetical protein
VAKSLGNRMKREKQQSRDIRQAGCPRMPSSNEVYGRRQYGNKRIVEAAQP